MNFKDKLLITLLSLGALFGLIYLSKAILMPFICAIVASYLLNPLVTKFHKHQKITRLRATLLVLGLVLALFICLSLILLPPAYSQTISLISTLPHYFNAFTTSFYPKIVEILTKFGFEIDGDFSHMTLQERMSSNMFYYSSNFLHNALNSSSSLLNILSLVFITPCLTFYILKDWNVIITTVSNYIPRNNYKFIQSIFKDIDATLSNYLRGQLNVCLILGTIYSLLLTLSGLNFGFVVGFSTGLLSFIPYVGMLIGIILALTISIFQWGFDITQLSIIGLIFLFGQVIESNFLTPKLVGSEIGLHPAWMIFGLFFFGNLFGFVGILAAIPLTAICSVIIKHLAKEYQGRYANAS